MAKSAVYTSITLLAAILVAGQMLKSQVPMPPLARQWEYAWVTSGQTFGAQATPEQAAPGERYQPYATAHTCYATSQGCGSSVTSRVEGNGVVFGAAMMKAASTLGDEGWELVSVTSGANGDRVMYFRRPKAAQK
jgi:hypothetical protein